MIKRFETKLLEEAIELLEKQNLKARKKTFQNIRGAEQQSDPKFFKKLTDDIGNLEIFRNSRSSLSILGQA